MKSLRLLAIVLLSFVAAGAAVGAIPLILYPHQQPWRMPQNLLEHSPFSSFLIPGIILLVANGLLCLSVLAITIRRPPRYGWWIAAQGCILFGWIAIECVLIRMVIWPHYLYAAIGVALVIAGLALRGDRAVS